MHRNLDEVEFVIFDTETTGLDSGSGDRIIEIAGVRIVQGRSIAQFESLINPHREVSAGAFSVNNISAQMLSSAPEAEIVIPKFLDFIQDSCLCSYNAGFDLGFLNQELKLLGRSFPEDVIVVDVLKMARKLMPGLERYPLWFVAQKLDIRTQQAHRAFSDVELTFGVFEKFDAILKEKGISDFKNFSHLFSITPGLLNNLDAQKIAELQEAIDLRLKIRMRYFSSATSKVSEREVIPKEIKQERGVSYLVGYCCIKNDERTFRLDGILHFEIV
ncbi:MAG: WYL domain-containing protein [Candidatus Omnitrophica bacterium]|nr:WYL domain-containing protein [Candidatus Omnitrophota bacterium]MBU1869362.1 WYL domain-containing protein [Candidatus Omnitrophota bacterium]